jgi:hypothetical protein
MTLDINEMKTIVRRGLHDEDIGGMRWSDAEIERHIDHAVNDFSEAVPDEAQITFATTAGLRRVDLSVIADRVYLETVEYPVGRFPPQLQAFSLWKDELTLLGGEVPDGSDISIYYGRKHALDLAGTSIPPRFYDLVAEGAAGYAAVQWALYAVNRTNTGGTETPQRIQDWGKARLELFYSRLKTFHRNNRVRANTLYRPVG